MGRGRIVNALSFFVFLKNVFLNRHSCYYRIDNLNLRFAFLKLVISATIAVTILPNHLWIGRCRGQQFVVGSYNKKGRNLFCDRFVRLLQNCAHKRPIFTLFFFDSLLLLYQDIILIRYEMKLKVLVSTIVSIMIWPASIVAQGELIPMIEIPAGNFYMGTLGEDENYDEAPMHKVYISKPFKMGLTEVTNAQYELFCPEHKSLRGKVCLQAHTVVKPAVLFLFGACRPQCS